MSDDAEIELTNAIEKVVPGASLEDLMAAIAKVERVKAIAATAKKRLDELLLEVVRESGPFKLGATLYRIKEPIETKCTNFAKTLELLFMRCDGSFEKVAEALGANAIKHGHCKGVLQKDEWNEVFEVRRVEKLDKQGKEIEQVEAVDMSFAR